MQNTITLKNFMGSLRSLMVILCLACTVGVTSAQIVVSTASGTGYTGDFSINNPGALGVSFVIQNTTAAAVALTNVSTQMGTFTGVVAGTPSVTKLFVSTTSLSGVYDLSTPAWSQIATGAAVVPATVSIVPVISGINYVIPAGAQYRFVIELSKGLRFSGPFAGFPMPAPNTFTTAGIVLKLGNSQIAALNIGYAGVSPVPAAPERIKKSYGSSSLTNFSIAVSTISCSLVGLLK